MVTFSSLLFFLPSSKKESKNQLLALEFFGKCVFLICLFSVHFPKRFFKIELVNDSLLKTVGGVSAYEAQPIRSTKYGWTTFARSDLTSSPLWPFSYWSLRWLLCGFQASPDHQHCALALGYSSRKYLSIPEAFLSLSEGPLGPSSWHSPMHHACLSPLPLLVVAPLHGAGVDRKQCPSQTIFHQHQAVQGGGEEAGEELAST